MEESIFNLRLLIEEWKGSLTGCAVKIVNLGIINLWKRIERQENHEWELIGRGFSGLIEKNVQILVIEMGKH